LLFFPETLPYFRGDGGVRKLKVFTQVFSKLPLPSNKGKGSGVRVQKSGRIFLLIPASAGMTKAFIP